MEIRRVVFQFKGSRNYIHGTDMFNEMIRGHPASAMRNIHFTAHDYVHVSECNLYLTDSKDEVNTLNDVRARCQFDLDSAIKWLALTPAGVDAAFGDRYEYDENRVLSLCNMDGDGIALARQSPFTFIETIVAMNKYLHQQMFPDAPGNWLFTRIDLTAGCGARENLALRFKHNLNYRLTKSDILVEGQRIGDLFFSLVR